MLPESRNCVRPLFPNYSGRGAGGQDLVSARQEPKFQSASQTNTTLTDRPLHADGALPRTG